MENSYQKLSGKFKLFGIFTLIYFLLSLVDTYLVDTSISGIFAIINLIIEILFIVDAKKAAKDYERPELNRFANFFIGALLLAFATVIVIFSISFQIAFAVVMGHGSTVVNILGLTLTSIIMGMVTTGLEFAGWFAMSDFFKKVEDVETQAKGAGTVKMFLIVNLLLLVEHAALGIPKAFMNPTIDLSGPSEPLFSGPDMPLEVIDAILSVILNIMIIVAYFKLADVLRFLGSSVAPPTPALQPVRLSASPALWQPAPGSLVESPGTPPATIKCPSCGMSFPAANPPALFCPLCGAKL
nr:zinc ribbon domain-containing protein [Candidatus Sigynarchaeota archaeon]